MIDCVLKKVNYICFHTKKEEVILKIDGNSIKNPLISFNTEINNENTLSIDIEFDNDARFNITKDSKIQSIENITGGFLIKAIGKIDAFVSENDIYNITVDCSGTRISTNRDCDIIFSICKDSD